jgi:hypothetical protein
MKLAFSKRDENKISKISTETPRNSGYVCEFSIVMFNKIQEELHAKTLTNLGTKEFFNVCVKNEKYFYSTN